MSRVGSRKSRVMPFCKKSYVKCHIFTVIFLVVNVKAIAWADIT